MNVKHGSDRQLGRVDRKDVWNEWMRWKMESWMKNVPLDEQMERIIST